MALFDTASYKKARTFSIGMRMVAYSLDGTRIATAEGTDGARVWDAAVPGQPMPKSVPAGEYLPGVEDLYLLDTPLQVLQAPSRDRKQVVYWAEFSPDGKRLITIHANGHVKVWNTSSWAVEDDLAPTDSEVFTAAFAPDSKTVVIGDANGVLHQWSVEKKAEIKTTSAPLGAIVGLVFAPDGKSLVTTHVSRSGGWAMIWNTARWTERVRRDFKSAAFSKDGKMLALGGRNIALIDPASWKQIRTIELPEMTMREIGSGFGSQPHLLPYADKKIPISVIALAFSPDARTLAAGCRDGTVRLVKMNQ